MPMARRILKTIGNEKKKRLKRFIDLSRRVPSHDTIGRCSSRENFKKRCWRGSIAFARADEQLRMFAMRRVNSNVTITSGYPARSCA